tara:strand:- start:20 stop:532 length:513 start_codon:yes stop_codon:yes gene_type:complete
MDIKRDAFPPTPITPPMLRGTGVVFRYRGAATVMRAYRAAVEEYARRDELSSKGDDIAFIRDEVAALEAIPEADRSSEERKRIRESHTYLAAYEGLEPLDSAHEDNDEVRARLLGMVVHSVVVGGKEHLWPSEHSEAVAFIRDVAPHRAVAELLWCIAREEYNEADAGKS